MNTLHPKNFLWKFFKKLSNLNVSLFILFLIIICCVLGSILEQDQDISYYALNYFNYFSLIIFCGLNHVFRTWWFIFLLCILVTSLISCTFSTQLPSLKNARRWKFIYGKKKANLSNYAIHHDDESNYSSINVIYSLIYSNFFVFCRTSSIYAYKGLYGRVAPIFVHFSIIAILIGSLYGFFYSFVLQEIVPVGEIFHFKNVVYSGFYSTLRSSFLGHIDDFYIKYYPNGSVKQFFSKVSLYLSNQKSFKSDLIYVNKPMRFNKIVFYQTDWELNAVRVRLGPSYCFQQKLFKRINNGQTFWVSSLQISENKKVLIVLTSLNNKVLICSDTGVILKEVLLQQKFYLNSIPFSFESIISSTGLQIKHDPSILLVYFGFFLMIFTTFMSYLSYSQIWIYYSATFLEFFGSTNRAILFFEQDVILINQMYISYSYYRFNKFKKDILLLR